jgi:hypothetical protein
MMKRVGDLIAKGFCGATYDAFKRLPKLHSLGAYFIQPHNISSHVNAIAQDQKVVACFLEGCPSTPSLTQKFLFRSPICAQKLRGLVSDTSVSCWRDAGAILDGLRKNLSVVSNDLKSDLAVIQEDLTSLTTYALVATSLSDTCIDLAAQRIAPDIAPDDDFLEPNFKAQALREVSKIGAAGLVTVLCGAAFPETMMLYGVSRIVPLVFQAVFSK